MLCGGCDQPLEPRRPNHQYHSAACRVRGLARRRAEDGRAALAALDRLRSRVAAEVARWEAIAAGRSGAGDEPARGDRRAARGAAREDVNRVRGPILYVIIRLLDQKGDRACG